MQNRTTSCRNGKRLAGVRLARLVMMLCIGLSGCEQQSDPPAKAPEATVSHAPVPKMFVPPEDKETGPVPVAAPPVAPVVPVASAPKKVEPVNPWEQRPSFLKW